MPKLPDRLGGAHAFDSGLFHSAAQYLLKLHMPFAICRIVLTWPTSSDLACSQINCSQLACLETWAVVAAVVSVTIFL